MKKISILTFAVCLLFVLISGSSKESTYDDNSLEGVWEMEHQYIYDNNEILDTLYNLNGYRQVKMYTKNKVMWTRYNPTDSNEWYGYGTYDIVDGILEERLEYASNAMMKIVDTVQVFRFKLEIGKDTYSQITFDNEGKKYNSENYRRIE
jgi:hypothetical protein